jgi:hypothetical protein
MDYYQEQQMRLEEIRTLIQNNTDRMFYECDIGEAHKNSFTVGAVTDLAARLFIELSEEQQKRWTRFLTKEKS